MAQAVQIACYELFRVGRARQSAGPADGPAPEAATTGYIEAKVGMLAEALGAAGFFTKSDDSYLRQFLRDISERAFLSSQELDYFVSIIAKAAALGSGRGSPRRKSSFKGEPR